MSRTFELPLSPNYVRSWGATQAVRELIQNQLDSDAPLEYSFVGDTLTLTSRDVTLGHSTLVMGVTTKDEDATKIGSFGEGYKIALLVLTREGLDVTVENGAVDWKPSFKYSESYSTEVLCIEETDADRSPRDLRFVIKGLGHEQSNEIRDSCLVMQPAMDDKIKTCYGDILPSRPGKLYVGGLYVCDTDLIYGYDINPSHISLERDRQTVCSWDLKNVSKNMWFDTKNWDDIAAKMEENIPDLALAEYGAPDLVKEACYRQFTKRHPGAIVASSHKEMEDLVTRGMTKVVQVSGGYYSAISRSQSYQEYSSKMIRVQTPAEWLASWLERHQRTMSHPLRAEFKQILKEAKSWKVK